MDTTEYIDENRLNKTRKKRRAPEPKPERREEWPDWPHHLERGEKLYTYMTKHFNTIFDEDNFSKAFDIRPAHYGYDIDEDVIMNTFGDDIQIKLRSWIQTEICEKQFFERILWKSIRDQCNIRSSFLVYKKLFKYSKFFFQLFVNDCSDRCDDFKNEKPCRRTICVHFELGIFAWTTEEGNTEPTFFTINESDMNYPENLWNLKNGGA
jgi:hypothetical protein